jgi:hypothetical protein
VFFAITVQGVVADIKTGEGNMEDSMDLRFDLKTEIGRERTHRTQRKTVI